MAYFNWNESLSVDIDLIDDQHMKLIGLINDFYESLKNSSNSHNLALLIGGLKQYTIEHFTMEERYMQQFDYPDYLNHKKEHEHFVNKVAEVEEKIKNGKFVLSFEITKYLKEWITTHIQGTDRKYVPLFVENLGSNLKRSAV